MRRHICLIAAMALLGTGVVALRGTATAAAVGPVDREPSVGGRPVPVAERVVGAEDRVAVPAPRRAPVWPVAAGAEVALSGSPGLRSAGSLPVRLESRSVARVAVEVLDAATANRLGGAGLGVRLRRADGVTKAGPVRVALDYSRFAGAYDASFPDRLRLVRLPACVLGGHSAATGCPLAPERVAAVNDGRGQLVSDVDVGAGMDAPVLLVVTSATGTFSGNFAATDLAAAGKWQVGLSSGAFTYSYPVPEAPSVAGGGPGLEFGYSSAAVDGLTAASNHQSGWTGLGWTLSPGFIERRYKPCADDATGPGKRGDQKNWGHLCWESPDENDGQAETTDPLNSDLILSLEGRSSHIVKDRLSNTWKTEDDFGWRIEYLPGGALGQPYWRVTTLDGDVYRFGFRRDSMWQVPFAGDDPGEPCRDQYLSGGSNYPGMCNGPWRWNLDQVVDANENITTLYWKREAGKYRWYARELCCSDPPVYDYVPKDYDRGGYLDYIEWGANSTVAGSVPVAKTVFNMVSRCGDTTTRDDPLANPYPIDTGTGNLSCLFDNWDVPTELMTCTTNNCPGGSPAFFIVRRLDSIVTYSWDPVAARWDDVAKLQLRFKYVWSPDDGQGGCCTPALWLDYLRPVGLAGAGEIRLPAVDFQAVELNGRVNYGPILFGLITAPKAILPRISNVYNGLGGRVDVTYGRTRACPDGGTGASGYSTWHDAIQWDRADWDCYRVYDFYFPFGGGPELFYGIYHKYVVTKVVEKDLVAASPDVVTGYEYLGRPAWARPIDYLGTKATVPSNDTGGTTVIETATWSDARGYDTVRVSTGSGTDPAGYTVDTHSFLRGMFDDVYANGTAKGVTIPDFDGNAVPDRRWWSGEELQQRSWRMTAYSADPAQRQYAEVESTRYEHSRTVTGDGPGVLDPAFVRPARTRSREVLADGSLRYTDGRSTYDSYGLPIQRNDYGVDGVADNSCESISYARNTGLWLVSYPSTTERRTGDDCTAGPVIGRSVTLYDGGTDPATNQPTDGNVTETRAWTDAATVSVEKAGFDDYGRAVSTTDALGKTTSTAYSPAVNWPTNGVTVTNPLGHRSTTFPDRLYGRVTKVLDVDNNRVTEADYDQLGRITAVWGPAEPRTGGTPSATMSYTIPYDGAIGQPTAAPRTSTSELLSGTGTAAKWDTTYGYEDGWGRSRESQAVSPSGGRIVAATSYDTRGLPSAVGAAAHNAAAAGSGLLNPAPAVLPSWTRHSYDGQEQPVVTAEQTFGTELRRSTMEYRGADGYVITPPTGGATEYWSDADGRVTRVVEWVFWGVSQTTRYEYDLNGNLTKITDANGNVRTFGYDWAGRRISTTDPDAGTSTYTYDADDRLVSTVDGRGQKLSYVYDDLGRRTATWAGEVGTGTKLAQWTYDTVAKGQLTSSTAYAGGNAYTDEVLAYDAAYRPTSTRLTVPAAEGALAGTYQFTASYDRAGNQIESGLPAAGGLLAETITNTYTDLGLPDRLTSDYGGGSIYVNGTTYSKTGKLAERRYGSRGQVKRTFTWDDATNRLTNVTTLAKADTAAPVTAQNDDFYYDSVDNVSRIADRAQSVPQSECFVYDTRNRLNFAWTTTKPDCSDGWWLSPDGKGPDPYWRSYTYDAAGNILSQDTSSNNGVYVYPAPGPGAVRPNAVTKVQWPGREDTYGYDAAGQLTSRTVAGQTTSYEWDPLGRLTKATTGGQATSNVYDADGDRLIRREPGRTTLYLGQMELELVGSTVTARRYYLAGDGAVVAVRAPGVLTWLLADLQRSEQLAVDNATSRVDRQRYLPFGARRGGRDDITATQRGFLGKTEDDTTGLVNLGARFYDPTIGKFTTPDPMLDLRMPEWANPYAYAGNNPVSMSDSTGLTVCLEPGDCPAKKPPKPKKPPKKKKKAKVKPWNSPAAQSCPPGRDCGASLRMPPPKPKVKPWNSPAAKGCPPGRDCGASLRMPVPKKPSPKPPPKPAPPPKPKENGSFWDNFKPGGAGWNVIKVGLVIAAAVTPCTVLCGGVAAGMSAVDTVRNLHDGDYVGAALEAASVFTGGTSSVAAAGVKAAKATAGKKVADIANRAARNGQSTVSRQQLRKARVAGYDARTQVGQLESLQSVLQPLDTTINGLSTMRPQGSG